MSRRSWILVAAFYAVLAISCLAPLASDTVMPIDGQHTAHTAAIVQAHLALAQGQFPIRVAPWQHQGWQYPLFQFIEADETSAAFLFDALVHLHRARWRSRDQGGVLCDPRVLLFHKRLLPALVRTSIVQLHALQIGGEIAAVYYGFEDRGRAYAYLGGFDPQRAFASPGTLLLAHVIMKSCRSGLQEFHFLRGSEAYKLEWGAQIRHNRCRTLRRVQAPCNA